MNFSSSNNQAASNHPTPVSQGPPSVPSTASFEQYRSPLVNNYFSPNYATLRVSSAMSDSEEPPEVPPLPTTPTLEQNSLAPPASPLHYRTLQSTPSIAPKAKIVNTGTYFPKVASDPPNRKRYHTAPREKQRVSTLCKLQFTPLLFIKFGRNHVYSSILTFPVNIVY